jgi:hypothetical protein
MIPAYRGAAFQGGHAGFHAGIPGGHIAIQSDYGY